MTCRIRPKLLAYIRSMRLVLLFLCYAPFANAQLLVTPCSDTLTPETLIRKYFKGSNVTIRNIRFNGDTSSIGLFSDAQSHSGFPEGIIICTGLAEQVAGPNGRQNAGANLGRYFFTDNDLATEARMCDGVVLEFDFVPEYDSIYFQFVFGSEEYPEFVNKDFNDVFGFYLKPAHPAGIKPENIALLPDGTPVTINNVNHERNHTWYIANNDHHFPAFESIEYDGFTKPVYAAARVVAKKTYHLKIIIADLTDCEYDSGIFLGLNTFNSIPVTSGRKPASSKK